MPLSLTLSLALSLLAPALSAALSPSARAFTLPDVPGTYTRFVALQGSETLCPTTITHSLTAPDPANPSASTIPHASILHDNVPCTGTASSLLLPLSAALREPQIQAAIRTDPTGTVPTALENAQNQSTSLLAYDAAPRTCGSAVGLPANTAYLLVNEPADVSLLDPLTLPAGTKYMVLVSQSPAGFIGCVYSASGVAGPGRAPTQAPSTTTPPTAAPGAACFPADARVALEAGGAARMADLRAGDRVAVGGGRFSAVFGFTHADGDARAVFVEMTTASGAALCASPGHYVYAGGALTAARAVRVGDALERADGRRDVVVRVRRVVRRGLFNPQTLDGGIVVDRVRVSTYTEDVHPLLAHAALAPLRALFAWGGVRVLALPRGAGGVAGMLPSGGGVV